MFYELKYYILGIFLLLLFMFLCKLVKQFYLKKDDRYFVLKLGLITLLSMCAMVGLLYNLVEMTPGDARAEVPQGDASLNFLFLWSPILAAISAISVLIILKIINGRYGASPDWLVFYTLGAMAALVIGSTGYLTLESINFCRRCLATLSIKELMKGGLCCHRYKVYLLGEYDNWMDLFKILPSTLWLYNLLGSLFALYLLWAMLKCISVDWIEYSIIGIDKGRLKLLALANMLLVKIWLLGLLYIYASLYTTLFSLVPTLFLLILIRDLIDLKRNLENEEWSCIPYYYYDCDEVDDGLH